MKLFKQFFLLVLVFVMVTTSCIPVSVFASNWEKRSNEADLRVGFFNDVHITKTGSGEAKGIVALDTFKALGMDKLAFVGDNVYYTKASDDPLTDQVCYDKLDNAMQSTGWSWQDVLVYAMGNHEFPQGNTDVAVNSNAIKVWKERSGFDEMHHTTYKGYHFIGLAPESADNRYIHCEDYMREQIDAALAVDSTNDINGVFPDGVIPDSEKPVFLFTHKPMGNTITNGANTVVTNDFMAYLAKRPQVVCITAHVHRLAQHPENIGQDAGFTTFLAPMIAGGNHIQWDCVEDGNITDAVCSQGAFMEIKDNIVSFYRLDFLNGNYIGEPYVVDIPSIVADQTNEISEDDYAHMPFRTEVRKKVTSKAAFPEDAKLDVVVTNNTASITYPNTASMISYDALQQDNFVRAYKLEITDENGAKEFSGVYQADFWKSPENRAESYTRTVGSLSNGKSYIVNVYPMTPFGSFGDPISAGFTTESLETDKDTIRVEIEDFSTFTEQNKFSEYVSGNNFVLSAQGGWISSPKYIERTQDGSAIVIKAKVNAPVEGEYDVRYAVGYQTNATKYSKVTLSVGDDVIGDNTSTTFLEDYSIDGTFPWQHIPLKLFQGRTVSLTKGENTIDIKIELPSSSTQPFLFCLDYIDFIPQSPVINLLGTERIEFEDYIDSVGSIKDASTDNYKPKVAKGAKASGGKYLSFDSDVVESGVKAQISIPFYVSQAGEYSFKYVNVNLNNTNIYLDTTSSEKINKTVTKTVIDASKELDDSGQERYQTFSTRWFAAYSNVFNANLSEGNHTLIVEIEPRGEGDIVQYFDYIDIIPATERLQLTKDVRFEFEDYVTSITPKSPKTGEHDKASMKKLVFTGSGSVGQNDSLELPLYVEDAGVYEVEFHAAAGSHLSTIDIKANDRLLFTAASNGEDISEGKTYYNKSYPLKKYIFTANLEKGLTKLVFDINYRSTGSNSTTAYAMDFVEIRPLTNGNVSQNDVMKMEFESLVGKIPAIPMADSTVYNAVSKKSAECSGEAYMLIDSLASNDTYYEFSVLYKIDESGLYNIDYVTTFGVSAFDVFLGTSKDGRKLDVTYVDDTTNIGKNGTGEMPDRNNWYKYFNSSWAKMRHNKSTVSLSKGYQLVTFRLQNRGGSTMDFAQYLDFFRIAPVETFEISNGVANMKSVYDSNVSGKAILALYSNKCLVSCHTLDVSNTKVVNISAPVSEPVDCAKMFVWSDMTNITPVVKVKEITIK